ncbi:hypothetical protein D1007_37335 [Hordeum vulgare]|nr:hypothetical protein D1007_37335 [Hordeum vulgare]
MYASSVLAEPVMDVCNVVVIAMQTRAAPISLEDFLRKVTCPLSQPQLGNPVPSNGDKNDGQQSGRVEKKNKACNIPTSKSAEYMILDFFGELPEVSKGEGP